MLTINTIEVFDVVHLWSIVISQSISMVSAIGVEVAHTITTA